MWASKRRVFDFGIIVNSAYIGRLILLRKYPECRLHGPNALLGPVACCAANRLVGFRLYGLYSILRTMEPSTSIPQDYSYDLLV